MDLIQRKKKKENERTHQRIWDEYINKKVRFPNGTELFLGDKLRNDGYDIIIYDYEDGGDLIEKNALAVVQLLQTLYSQYQNTLQDDFVVIGPSYGSLVAQYALAYCEKNNIGHHTRLYISFDGPQQGANVPIGLQQMVDYFLQKGLIGDIFSNAKNGLHRTNAARQMLVHHSIANSETPAPDNFRNIFKSNLTAVGEYPTICRKIAIINGSNDALSNTLLAPCGEMVHFSMNKLISSNKKLNWNCYASAKTNRCESLNMLTDGWLLRKVIGQPKVKILYTQPAANNNSYDAAPGGYFEDTFSEYDGKVRFWAAIAFGWMRKKEYRHNVNATFMPSVSAADIRLPSFNLSYNFKNINLACEGLSPFDRVYAPPINEPHVSITSNNAGWFETEIKGKPGLIPNGSVYDVNISTSATCIDSTPVTLTASSNAGTAVQYIWTVGTELKIVSGQGTSSIQVVKNVPNSTISTVTVSVNSHCGNGTFSKNITVGAPTILTLSGTYTTEGFSAYIDENQSQFCLKSYMFPGFYSGVIALNDQVATNYNWELVSKYPSTATTGIGLVPGTTKDYEVYVKPQNGMATYRLTTTNACGSSSRDFTFVADGDCLIAYAMQSPTSESITIAPNPADNSFTVILEVGLQSNTETSNTTKTAMDYDIKLYDKNMRELKKAKSKGENVTITIADLPNDIYYLIIKDGKNTVNKQILVQH
ncbi:T9SS type A sorting domain-containing protein [Solitalea lacus]|uniref:T9SS type A sorting domain-containing protein n=1 Tax=Solitalea lacus TaxID=2911172 RepID=UPI001EDBFEA4|nr:T9SS type A sorting domain-containing protein [Solitalea lacus]UKJ07134.1 T9SS type A sorting domain-containing protein [Solitalea lacus]